MPANKITNEQKKILKQQESETAKAETKLIDDKTVGLFTKQMKDWGYESKEEFANEIMKHEIGDVVDGKKVTKLLKERAQLIIEV